MAIGVNNTILASDYNSIQSTVASILGTGSGDRGYGQAVSSSQVAATNTITATQMQNLKTDLDKIRYHQANAASTAPSVSAGGVIYASDWSSYSSQASSLDGTRFNLATEQATLSGAVTKSAANNSWNTSITHSFTVNFGSADAARYFFNAGGEIRVGPTITGFGGPTTKGGRWNSLFSTAGSIKFKANTTTSSGGSASAIGWYNLSGSQQIFSIVDTGTYSGNDFTVTASKTSSTLSLTIQYNDDGNTGNIDENIDGALNSNVQYFTASGSYVNVAGPSIS
jgi:hypothetical protein